VEREIKICKISGNFRLRFKNNNLFGNNKNSKKRNFKINWKFKNNNLKIKIPNL